MRPAEAREDWAALVHARTEMPEVRDALVGLPVEYARYIVMHDLERRKLADYVVKAATEALERGLSA